MKKILLSSILIVLNLLAAGRAFAINTYDEFEFELPISHKDAVKVFSLDAESPLRKGGVDNREILLHKGEGGNVVGVTFYSKFGSHEKLTEAVKFHHDRLEQKYSSSFSAFEFGFFSSVDGKYHVMALEEGTSIVLGDVTYNGAGNNYLTVSFFKYVSEQEIRTLLNSIY